MEFDLVIRSAEVYPGEGAPVRADVGVAAGRIAAVEPSLPDVEAREDLRAEGMILCPGFVDMHAHSALVPFADPILAPKIAQGFTTELINPDGLAPAPLDPARVEDRRAYLMGLEGSGPEAWTWSSFEEYLRALDSTKPTTTLVSSAAHNSVRDHVIGGAKRAPSSGELDEMRRQVRLCLEAGARTLSFGLIYLPGAYAETAELVALAEEAARFGAPLVPHIRNESEGVLEALEEMVAVARRSGAPLHVSHLKSRADEQVIDEMLSLLDSASSDVSLTFDQYPYGAGSTVLSALLPAWAQEGGASGTLERLVSGSERARMRRDIEEGIPGWENIYRTLGPDRITIANASAERASAIGSTLSELANGDDPIDVVFDLLRACHLNVTMISHYATEEAVRQIASHRLHLVGSDGIFGAKPHPRLYGTAARFLGRYAIREGIVAPDEAVARLTVRAARRLGLTDRGEIVVGKRADLVLLNPGTYLDTATYDDPRRFPEGVELVWVAGTAVWRDGAPTGARPGGVVQEPLPLR